MEYEKFYAKVIKIGNNSKGVIIPEKNAKFAGYEIGDELKIMTNKAEKK